MRFYIANLGQPATDNWWRRTVALGIISAGFDNEPWRGEGAMLMFEAGDWVIAYVNEAGYVGAGIAGDQTGYKFVRPDELPPGYESTHRHWRPVAWKYVIPNISRAITIAEANRQPPPRTVQLIRDAAIGKRLVDLIAQRSPPLRTSTSIGNPLLAAPITGKATGASDSASDDDFRGPEDARQLRAIRLRRGQPNFRARLLDAWHSRCVVTECRVESLLEAAHITPHAEETDYRTCNGLLLRTDIHTLYDLALLSIDEFMRVRLASQLMASEYRQYDGKRIERRPDAAADAPSVDALRRRHQRFLAAQDGSSEV